MLQVTEMPPEERNPDAEVLEFYLNGEKVKVADPDPRQMLIEYLRDAKGLSGTKRRGTDRKSAGGCSANRVSRSCLQGGCGACVAGA